MTNLNDAARSDTAPAERAQNARLLVLEFPHKDGPKANGDSAIGKFFASGKGR